MSTVVDLEKADDPRDVIHQAVHLLAQGELVGLPTETVYIVAAHGLHSEAVEKLREATTGTDEAFHALAIRSAEEAWDYAPGMPRLGRKLTRRCWPGPVTMVFDISGEEGICGSLPEVTRELVAPEKQLHLRVPAYDVVLEILRLMPAPLVMSPEAAGRAKRVTSAQQVVELYGDRVSMVVDDGPSRYGEPSTVISVSDNEWTVLRPGVVTETILGRLASEVYLFVCTGNTCRSPMAEGMFRKLLSEKLQCSEDDLVDRGFIVASAGMSAAVGAPASPEGVALLSQRGIDLGNHESQPLTDRLLDQADHIYTMTRGHCEAILARRPDLADRIELLARDQSDISDPMGGGLADYRQCADEIERHVRGLIQNIPTKP